MSQENVEIVEIVRQPISVTRRSRRRPEEQLVRFPRVLALAARVLWAFYFRLPQRSRLRQAIVRHLVEVSFEALNRGDLDVAFTFWHPRVETTWAAEVNAFGFEVDRSLDARIESQRRWMAEWGEFWIEPEEVF